MIRFKTLRGRLTAVALLATTIAVALVVAAFNVVLENTLDHDVTSKLRSQAAAVATTVSTPNGKLTVHESPNDQAIDSQVWVFEGKRAVRRSNGSAQVQRTARELAGRTHVFKTVGDPGVRLYALGITDRSGQVGTVVTGQSMTAYERTREVALTGTIVLALILLLAVYAGTWITIGRALHPVVDMTRSASDWSEHDLDRRFGVAPRPDELGKLAATFDALLDRVAASLRHEQRLSAELSHELRTPLARILAELELLQRRERSAEDRQEAYDVVTRSAEQMSRILETLMAAARAEAQPDRGRSDLVRTLDDLEQTWSAALARRGVALEVELEDSSLPVGVDGDIVERVIAPVLDNAGRYARSRVTMSAARAGGRVLITINDDGPGLAEGDAETLFEPGVRGTNGDGHAGAGLGLALARRLARAAGGDVGATQTGEGEQTGASFVVEFPA